MHIQRRLLDHLGEGEALPEPPVGLNIEGLSISSRPASARMPKGEASHAPNSVAVVTGTISLSDKTSPDQVVGVKRARIDE